MIALAVILFFVLFLRVRTYKECMSGGASNSKSGGGFAGRLYSYDGSLDSVYRDGHLDTRLSGPFTRCSPESHPLGCGSKASALIVPGVQKVWGIPHVSREN
jgi:hypothetical protein